MLFNLCIYRYWEIPFIDTIFSGFVITPKHHYSETLEDTYGNLKQYRQKLAELRYFAPDPHSQRKFEYSRNMIRDRMKEMRNNIEQLASFDSRTLRV